MNLLSYLFLLNLIANVSDSINDPPDCNMIS